MSQIKELLNPNEGNRIEDLLKLHPNLRYEESIFFATAKDLGQSSEAEFWSQRLNIISTVEDMLSTMPEEIKGPFLKIYIHHMARGIFA